MSKIIMQKNTTLLLLFFSLFLTSCTAMQYGMAERYKNQIFPVNSLNGKFDSKIGEHLLDLEERCDPTIKKYVKKFGKPDYIYREEYKNEQFTTFFIYLNPLKSVCFTKSSSSVDSQDPSGTTVATADSIPENIESQIIAFYSMHGVNDTINNKDQDVYKWFISLYSEVNHKYKNGTGFNDEILQSDLKTPDNNSHSNLVKWADYWSTKAETAIIPDAENYMKQDAEAISKDSELLKSKIKSLMIDFINKNWDKINSSFPKEINIKKEGDQ